MLKVDIEKRLSNCTLKVKLNSENNTIALLGASGAGKSMTLKCIAGIEKPDKGTIELDGVTLFDSERRINLKPQKRNVGYLFQDFALFPNMTVKQNILAGLKKEPRDKRASRCEKLIQRFRLSHLKDRRPATLSGGEQQRLALARILASDPKVLLLDEPFSSLDSYLKWQLETELKNVIDHFDGDIITVSHDIAEVSRMCEMVSVISGGVNEEIVRVAELLSAPKSVDAAKLIGVKNLSSIEIVDDHTVFAKDFSAKLKVKADPAHARFIGIKDDDLRLSNGETENTFTVKAERIIHENDRTLAQLTRENTTMMMQIDDDTLTPGQTAEVFLDPETILLLG